MEGREGAVSEGGLEGDEEGVWGRGLMGRVTSAALCRSPLVVAASREGW